MPQAPKASAAEGIASGSSINGISGYWIEDD
jgi:hypothetical protein